MRIILSKKLVLLVACILSCFTMSGQFISDIRINEIQVINKNGFKDEYGHSSSWIELFNTGYGKINIGGAYIKVKDKTYRIPRSNRTVMPARSYLILYAGGASRENKGDFYTNFSLDETNYITIYSSDNTELLDSLHFNRSEMVEDVTYGWFKGHGGTEQLMNLPAVTPGADNNTLESVPRDELFRQADPSGVVITITAVTVVAITLILLYLIFVYMGKFHIRIAKKKEKRSTTGLSKEPTPKHQDEKESGVITNEEIAAIAIALYKYSKELHDQENTILTINRAAKAYSPWSSKIYGLREQLNKKRL